MITKKLELEFWYKMFNSTFHQEKDRRGVLYSVWREDENIFRDACSYHISRLTLPGLNVKYILRGVEYAAGEKAPEHFSVCP